MLERMSDLLCAESVGISLDHRYQRNTCAAEKRSGVTHERAQIDFHPGATQHCPLRQKPGKIAVTRPIIALRGCMDDKVTLNDTVALMRDLRKRCEWDAAQTHETLRPYLIEESQELDEALREGNSPLMREELGDLLLQVLFHSVIAEERGEFDVHDVARGLIAKMQ